MGDFGVHFVRVLVFLALSPSLSPSCASSFPSPLGIWYSHHAAHPLSSINPFLQLHKSTPTPCQKCSLLTAPAYLQCFLSLLRSNRGGKKLPLQLLLQGERKDKLGKGRDERDEAWRETWRRATNSCCCPTYSSCPFGNSRKLHKWETGMSWHRQIDQLKAVCCSLTCLLCFKVFFFPCFAQCLAFEVSLQT